MSFLASIFGRFDAQSLMITLLTLPFLIFSLCVHEFAHGYIAMKMGDYTAKAHGRLTLNPLAHLDPIGLIALIFFKFGWAKPVPINPYNFTNRKKGYILVSLAGPVSNLMLTVCFTLLYLLVCLVAPIELFLNDNVVLYYALKILSYAMSINIVLAVFNLIPIPPLDGSKILEAVLPYKYLVKVENLFSGYKGQIIIIVIFVILFATNILDGLFNFVLDSYFSLIMPIVNQILQLKI